MKKVLLFLTLFFWVMSFASHVYAYIDPATGSYVLQILIAGLVGGAFTIKKFWFQITMFFKQRLGRGDQESTLSQSENRDEISESTKPTVQLHK